MSVAVRVKCLLESVSLNKYLRTSSLSGLKEAHISSRAEAALTDSLPRSAQNLRAGAVASTGSSAPVSNWLLRVQRAQSVYGSMFQRSRSDSFIAPFRGRALSPFFIECIYVTEVIKQKCSGEVPAMTYDLSEAYV